MNGSAQYVSVKQKKGAVCTIDPFISGLWLVHFVIHSAWEDKFAQGPERRNIVRTRTRKSEGKLCGLS